MMLNLEQEQEKERQFICACGKAYFSYAALFTHVKQKHDGKVNSPTFRRQDQSSNLSLRTKEEDLVKLQPRFTVTVEIRALLLKNLIQQLKTCLYLSVIIKKKI